MRIDRNELICGVRPALLKTLFARDRFGTLTAMADLGLDEPDISRTLLALQSEGWIDYSGAPCREDQWTAGDKGVRLVATRLIKRFKCARPPTQACRPFIKADRWRFSKSWMLGAKRAASPDLI